MRVLVSALKLLTMVPWSWSCTYTRNGGISGSSSSPQWVCAPHPTRVLTQPPGCTEWRGGNRFLLRAVPQRGLAAVLREEGLIAKLAAHVLPWQPLPFPCSFPSSIRASEYNKTAKWLSNAPAEIWQHQIRTAALCCRRVCISSAERWKKI